MLDIGWSEMGLILLVALIVIGPKDLPRVARTVGKWSAKARGMAREFQRSLDDMAREAELQDIKAEIDKVNRTDLRARIEETVDPHGDLRRSLEPPRVSFDPDPPRPAAATATSTVPEERDPAGAALAPPAAVDIVTGTPPVAAAPSPALPPAAPATAPAVAEKV